MLYSTTALVLGAFALTEVVAGPTHAHLHRHANAHAKKDVNWDSLDWNNMGIDWSSAWRAGQHSTVAPVPTPAATKAAAAPAAPAPAPPPAATTPAASNAGAASSSSSNFLENDVADLFSGLAGISNARSSFGAKVAASGNTGDFYMGNYGNPYASNIIKVSSTGGYDFTNTFTNTQSKSITVNIWQKVGPDLQPLSGSAMAPHSTSLTFVLKPGKSQVVAFQENSQIGWAEACSATAISGAYATTWGEANFVPAGSGYDVSAIMNASGNNYKMTITSVEAPACTSDMNQNMWLTDTQPIGGSDGSCFIAQSTAHLTTIMGGTV